MFCLIFFIDSALQINLKGQHLNICLGQDLIALCNIDGANAFIWNAPPLFANQLVSTLLMNGTNSHSFYSLFTTTGRSALVINEINTTISIRCHDDHERMTRNATVEVVGKRDVSTFVVVVLIVAQCEQGVM